MRAEGSIGRRWRWVPFGLLVMLAALVAVPAAPAQQSDGSASQTASEKRPQARNVRVVSYSELDGRGPGAFKMAIQEVDGRWYLYLGHLWDRGWSIVDVTDPKKPESVNFIEGPENTWTIQMELAEDKMITALEEMPASWGGDPSAPFEEGVLIWDVAAQPTNPELLGHFETGGSGTHRNFYDGGSLVHLAAGMPGFTGNIYMAIDISDPANPVEAGRWFFPEQATGEADFHLSHHGPPYVVDDLAYLPYGSAGLVILDISDVSDPQLVGQLDFSPPFIDFIGAHSVLPLPERDLALVTSEAIRSNCEEPLNHTSVVDISDPANPVLLSTFPIPQPPPGLPYDDFCDKGGRFGPHNFNQHHHSPFTDHSDQFVYLTYFNAGLRIVEISNPRLPEEVGYFVPPEPTQRFGPQPPDSLVVQSEDVLVDSRGYIYLTNKNQGLWVLRYTGPKP